MDELYTTKDIASMLGISIGEASRLFRIGKLKSECTDVGRGRGRGYKTTLSEIERYVATRSETRTRIEYKITIEKTETKADRMRRQINDMQTILQNMYECLENMKAELD